MKHFHLAVEGLNTGLVEQFETGEEPGQVAERVGRWASYFYFYLTRNPRVLVPAVQILQTRTHRQPGSRDAAILEEVGGLTRTYIHRPGPVPLVRHDRLSDARPQERLLGDNIQRGHGGR